MVSVIAAAGILVVNLAAVYGPGGLNAVDGVRVLSRRRGIRSTRIELARAKAGGPVSVDVLGDASVTEWTVQPV